jgi:hypothetical protein
MFSVHHNTRLLWGAKKMLQERDKKEMGVPHSAHTSNVSTILKLLEGNSAFLQ